MKELSSPDGSHSRYAHAQAVHGERQPEAALQAIRHLPSIVLTLGSLRIDVDPELHLGAEELQTVPGDGFR